MRQDAGSKPLKHAPLSFWTSLTKYKCKGKIIENCILRQGLQSMKPPEHDPGSVGPVWGLASYAWSMRPPGWGRWARLSRICGILRIAFICSIESSNRLRERKGKKWWRFQEREDIKKSLRRTGREKMNQENIPGFLGSSRGYLNFAVTTLHRDQTVKEYNFPQQHSDV